MKGTDSVSTIIHIPAMFCKHVPDPAVVRAAIGMASAPTDLEQLSTSNMRYLLGELIAADRDGTLLALRLAVRFGAERMLQEAEAL